MIVPADCRAIEEILQKHPAVREAVVVVHGTSAAPKELVAYVRSRVTLEGGRRELRVSYQTPTRCWRESGRKFGAMTENISVRGLCLAGVSESLGLREWVSFRIPGPVGASVKELRIRGRVAWLSEGRAGVEIEQNRAYALQLAAWVADLALRQGFFVVDLRDTLPRLPLPPGTRWIIEDAAGDKTDVTALDLSSGGAAIEARDPAGWKHQRLRIHLTSGLDEKCSLSGRLVWVNGALAGVAFDLGQHGLTALDRQLRSAFQMQRWFSRDLRSHLETALPGRIIPTYYVLLDSFPLTDTGTVDLQRLPSLEKARTIWESLLLRNEP